MFGQISEKFRKAGEVNPVSGDHRRVERQSPFGAMPLNVHLWRVDMAQGGLKVPKKQVKRKRL